MAEGVDPRRVFKVRAAGRINDREWQGRDLRFLGEAAGAWIYFAITEDDKGHASTLLTQLDAYSHGRDVEEVPRPLDSFFDYVEEIAPYGPEDRRGPGIPAEGLSGPTVLQAELWPSSDWQTASSRILDLEAVIRTTGGSILAKDDRPRFTVVRLAATPETANALLDLPVVRRLRTPPCPQLEPSSWRNLRDPDIQLAPVIDGEPVGVIDDGVVLRHPLLREVVRGAIAVPAEHAWPAPSDHGTLVAGIAAYGDFESALLARSALQARPIVSARVLEPDPSTGGTRFPSEALAHRSIEEAIHRLHADYGVRVFNISITDQHGFSGPHVSPLTEMIDLLSRQLGIVCVVAAGNLPGLPGRQYDSHGRDWAEDYPGYCFDSLARLAEPAVAVNALTVGSIARSDGPSPPSSTSRPGDRAVAGRDQLSPFSRTGPGFMAENVKPDVVHYGGNWVIDDTGRLRIDDPGVGVVSLNREYTTRLLASCHGTSFGAPRVARLAAEIWDVYPNASSNLVRALVGLASRHPTALEAQFSDEGQRLRASGNGLPITSRATDSTQHRVSMVFDGEMRTNAVSVHPIPIPAQFARGGRSSRRFTVALAFDPPVRSTRRDYLGGWMKFDLLRGVTLDDIEQRYRKQDPNDREELFKQRHHIKLRPPKTTFNRSTLQVRSKLHRELRAADGDTYFLVVTTTARLGWIV